MDPAFDPRILDFPVVGGSPANNNETQNKQKRPYHSTVRVKRDKEILREESKIRQKALRGEMKELFQQLASVICPPLDPREKTKTILYRAIEYIQHANGLILQYQSQIAALQLTLTPENTSSPISGSSPFVPLETPLSPFGFNSTFERASEMAALDMDDECEELPAVPQREFEDNFPEQAWSSIDTSAYASAVMKKEEDAPAQDDIQVAIRMSLEDERKRVRMEQMEIQEQLKAFENSKLEVRDAPQEEYSLRKRVVAPQINAQQSSSIASPKASAQKTKWSITALKKQSSASAAAGSLTVEDAKDKVKSSSNSSKAKRTDEDLLAQEKKSSKKGLKKDAKEMKRKKSLDKPHQELERQKEESHLPRRESRSLSSAKPAQKMDVVANLSSLRISSNTEKEKKEKMEEENATISSAEELTEDYSSSGEELETYEDSDDEVLDVVLRLDSDDEDA